MKQFSRLKIFILILCANYVHGEDGMELVNVEPFTIYGIEISTTNEIEMNSDSPRIPRLWESFYREHYGQSLKGNPVYGVYTDYESDVNGRMSVIAAAKINMSDKEYRQVEVGAGKYLVFRKEGESPGIVVAAWQEIWNYFSQENRKYERAYTTDFEVYEGANAIAIYIAVK